MVLRPLSKQVKSHLVNIIFSADVPKDKNFKTELLKLTPNQTT